MGDIELALKAVPASAAVMWFGSLIVRSSTVTLAI
jgi:hypothetical protein